MSKILKSKYLRIILVALIMAVLVIPSIPLFHVEASINLPPKTQQEVNYTAPADCYWVGGTGSWSDATNHWATTDGGSAGVGNEPDATSNVHFTSLSGTAPTVTVDTTANCNNMTWSGVLGAPVKLQNKAGGYQNSLNIYGSLILQTGMSFSVGYANGKLNFKSTTTGKTITTNGVSIQTGGFGGMNFDGVGGEWTLQDNLSTTGDGTQTAAAITIVNGSLITNNNTVTITHDGSTAGTFTISGTNGRALTLGTSNITCNVWDATTTTGLTFSGASSTINIATLSSVGTFIGGSLTYGTVNFTGAGASTITGGNTFTNLSRTGTALISDSFIISNDQTVSSTLTLAGNSAINRLLVKTGSIGSSVGVTCNGTVVASNIDVEDIRGLGSASWDLHAITGLSGDCGGNSGITFTTGTNQYWYLNDGTWTGANWYLATGGSGGTGHVPIPQDTAVFDQNSVSATSRTITLVTNYRMSSINSSLVANIPTFNVSGNAITYGSITNGTANWTVTNLYFYGRGSNTLTTSGITMPQITVGSSSGDGIGGTLTLLDGLTSLSALTLYTGTLDFHNSSVTIPSFVSSTTTYTRALSLGTGTITLNSTAAINKWNIGSTNFTLTRGTSTIVSTSSLTNAQSFTGGGFVYNNLTIGGLGVYTFTFNDSNTFNTLLFDRSQSAKTITGTHTETITTLSIPVASTTVLTITNTSFSIAIGTFASEYLSISGSTANGGASFYAGATPPSVNGGSNSGWIFTEPSTPICTTLGATQILFYTAAISGSLDSLAGKSNGDVFFQYNTVNDFSLGSGALQTPDQFTSLAGLFTAPLSAPSSSLSAGTTYYFRIGFRYDVTSYTYGSSNSFTTQGTNGIATVQTLDAAKVGTSSVTLQGNILSTGGYTVNVHFDYDSTDGTFTAGQYTSTPVQTYTVAQSFPYSIPSGLTAATEYWYRAVLSYGTVPTITYGATVNFATLTTNGESTVITLKYGSVFSGYLESGDLLFTAESTNNYTGYTTLAPTKYFQIQLLDPTGTTILGAVPLWSYGDVPVSIYLNHDTVLRLSITDGGAYILKEIGMFATPPTSSYTLQPQDWQGSDLTLLDSWCLLTAGRMNTTYETTGTSNDLLVLTSDNGVILSDQGGSFFNQGIPAISSVRPNLFTQSHSVIAFQQGVASDIYDQTTWQANLAYSLNDLSAYRNIVYNCILGYAGGTDSPLIDSTNWTPYISWVSGLPYTINDTVFYDGLAYQAKQNFSGSVLTPPTDTTDWVKLNYPVWVAQVGTKLASDLNVFGGLFGVNGDSFAGFGIWFAIIVVMIIAVMAGAGALGTVIVCFPLILLGNYLRVIGIQITIVVAVAGVFLWVRQFWFKTT
jgi:hypothetical protein